MFYCYRYKQCYDESSNGFDDTFIREKGVNRDDRVHGSLLVLNELMRCSNAQWERLYEDLMQKLQCPVTSPPSVSFAFLKMFLSGVQETSVGRTQVKYGLSICCRQFLQQEYFTVYCSNSKLFNDCK